MSDTDPREIILKGIGLLPVYVLEKPIWLTKRAWMLSKNILSQKRIC